MIYGILFGKARDLYITKLTHKSSHLLHHLIRSFQLYTIPLYISCPVIISSTLLNMKSFTVLLPFLASGLFVATATAKVQFAGVNIAGCDFGCTNDVSVSVIYLPFALLPF